MTTQEPLSPAQLAWAKALYTNPRAPLVIERLMQDPRVLDALAAITEDRGETDALIMTCVNAELLATTFIERVAEERKTIERLRRRRVNLDEIRQEIDRAGQLPDVLGCMVVIPETAKQNAFKLIADGLDARLELANRNLLSWGVTRKSTDKAAAELAAIGKIAANVKHIAGKRMAPQVAVLAEAALAIRDVSIERVRLALKNTVLATKHATALRDQNGYIRG